MKKPSVFFIIITCFFSAAFFSCKPDPPLSHLPPSAKAGYDQTILLPTDSVVLDGSESKDPDGSISNFQWTKITGPASYVIKDSTAAQTLVKDLVEGNYQFELTVIDNEGLTGKDIMQVFVVKTLPGNCNGNYPSFNISISNIGRLSDARRPSVAGAGTKIVFAGGADRRDDNCLSWCNTLPSSAIDIYDVNTHTWSTAQLSQPRQGIGAVSCGNKLFFAGGANFELYFNNGIVYDNVDIYDVSTNTWTVEHLSLPRTAITAASLGNKVVFAGGSQDGFYGSTRVDIYDVPTNSWSTAELSVPRYSIDAVVDGTKIYFVGGETGDDNFGNASRCIDIYDISTNSWSTSTLESPYYAITDVIVGNTNYWIYYSENNHVTIKNMSTGAETEGCASYSYQGTFSINNDIIFPFPDNYGWVTIYNTVTGQWSEGFLINPNIPSSAAIVSVNNTVYLGGGLVRNYVYTNKVYALNW